MPSNQGASLESLYKAARGRGVEFAEEFVPTTRTFDASELRLSYTEWGDPSLPTVILLHGFAQTSHAWDLITLGLADRFHLISLDQRGHGDSEWASDGDYSLETQQNDLDEFIKFLGVSRLNLVGLSMCLHPEILSSFLTWSLLIRDLREFDQVEVGSETS